MGGRGKKHCNWLKERNVIALCDIDQTAFAAGLKVFPTADTYLQRLRDKNQSCRFE